MRTPRDAAVLPAVPVAERTMPKPQPATASAEVIAEGKKYYQRHCRYCHGDGLRSGNLNPDLRWSTAETHTQWRDIVIDVLTARVRGTPQERFQRWMERNALAIRKFDTMLSEMRLRDQVDFETLSVAAQELRKLSDAE